MVGDILQPTHLLFVLVVALLVLGPKRLPEVARQLGNGLRDFKAAISGEDRDDDRDRDEDHEQSASLGEAGTVHEESPAPPGLEEHDAVLEKHDPVLQERNRSPEEHHPAPEEHHPVSEEHDPVSGGHDEPHGEPGQPAEPATSTSASQPAAGADRPA